jgi:hypothetical protein
MAGTEGARGAGGVAIRPEAPAGGDPLLSFFPTAAEVPGLKAKGDARHCGSGEGLTMIYDGGYQRFVEAGVTSASQRFFELRGGTVEVTLHQMKNQGAADAFLGALCKDIKAKVESQAFKQTRGSLCVSAGRDSAYGYLVAGKLLAMASFDRGDVETTRAILGAIAKRAAGAKRLR